MNLYIYFEISLCFDESFLIIQGAVSGLLSSLVITSWIAVGAIIFQNSAPLLPLSTEKCYANNFSTTPISVTSTTLPIRLA